MISKVFSIKMTSSICTDDLKCHFLKKKSQNSGTFCTASHHLTNVITLVKNVQKGQKEPEKTKRTCIANKNSDKQQSTFHYIEYQAIDNTNPNKHWG